MPCSVQRAAFRSQRLPQRMKSFSSSFLSCRRSRLRLVLVSTFQFGAGANVLASVHLQQILPLQVAKREGDSVIRRLCRDLCVFDQEREVPLEPVLRHPSLLVSGVWVELGVALVSRKVAERGGPHVHDTHVGDVSAVDERKPDGKAFFGCCAAMWVAYNLLDGGRLDLVRGPGTDCECGDEY